MPFSRIEEIKIMKLISNTAFLTNLFLVALLNPAVSHKFENFLLPTYSAILMFFTLQVKREIAQYENSGLKVYNLARLMGSESQDSIVNLKSNF